MTIRTILTAMAVSFVLAGAAAAQTETVGGGPPQPEPPAGYDGQEYVDDRGCVYIRAGVGEETTWVPRVNRARQPLCGPQPGGTPDVAAVPTPVDDAGTGDGAGTETVPEVAAVPTPVAPATEGAADAVPAPVQANEGEPQPFQPDITIRSGSGPDTDAAPALPQIAEPGPDAGSDTGPTPEIEAPIVITDTSPEAEPEAVEPVRSAALSGQPMNPPGVLLPPIALPGGAQAIDPVFSPGRIGTPMPPAVAGQPRIIRIPPHTVPERIPVIRAAKSTAEALIPRADGSIRATRADVCAHAAETGQVYINRATGQPVRCGGLVHVNYTPEAPAGPSHIRPSGTVAVAGYGVTYRAPVSGRPTRAQALAGTDVTIEGVRSTLDGTDRRVIPSGAIQREAVPASNPVGRLAPVELRSIPSPPAGYRSVWTDGRINMRRGVIVRDYFYGGG